MIPGKRPPKRKSSIRSDEVWQVTIYHAFKSAEKETADEKTVVRMNSTLNEAVNAQKRDVGVRDNQYLGRRKQPPRE